MEIKSSIEVRVMQTSEVQTGILLQLPESMRAALNAYAMEKAAPIEAVIEMAIAKLLDEQPQNSEEDLAVGAFLQFLEKDIIEHPERLQSFTPEWVKTSFELVEGVEVDINEILPDEEDEST
jgi:antitoxin PrlF